MTIDDIFTTKEASELWGISQETVKKACTGQRNLPPRFTEDECRKSGGAWLVTRQGMERVYGKESGLNRVTEDASEGD